MRHDAGERNAKIMPMILTAVLIAMLLTPAVQAIGIAPAKSIYDYSPGKMITYGVDVVNNGHEELDVLVYSRGELADSIRISSQSFRMAADEQSRHLTVYLTMPDRMPLAGQHETDIVAVGSTPAPAGQKAVVKADIAVISKLLIDVPYPAKYAEGRIYVLDTEAGKPIRIDVPVFNKGSEDISSAHVQIDIYSSEGEKIDSMTTEKRQIRKGEQTKFTASAAEAYPAGQYKAKAMIYYDGRGIEAETMFSIGQLDVEIKSLIVDQFVLGQVAKFDILLHNTWNSELKNVYAEMQIYGRDNKVYTDFKTVAADIPAQGIGRLEGYWYTQGVEPGIYTAKITLHFANRISQKEFELEVQPNKIIARGLTTGEAISASEAVDFQKNGILILTILVMAAIIAVLAFKLRKRPAPSPKDTNDAQQPTQQSENTRTASQDINKTDT